MANRPATDIVLSERPAVSTRCYRTTGTVTESSTQQEARPRAELNPAGLASERRWVNQIDSYRVRNAGGHRLHGGLGSCLRWVQAAGPLHAAAAVLGQW